MKKRINKRLGMIFGTVGLLVITLFFVTAFGVSTPYWDDNPLKLAPGESKIVSLGLQNKVGSEDVTLRAELTNDGDGIATLTDENLEYFVPIGTSVVVPIKIEVPEDVEIPGVRQITISFTQVASGEGGMLRVAGGFTTKFPVEIVGFEESELYEEPVPKTKLFTVNFLIILIVLIAVVIAIIVFLIMRKNKK